MNNKKMLKKNAAEEALCALYRLHAKTPGGAPCDAQHAIGALELLVLKDPAAKKRMDKFKARLAA